MPDRGDRDRASGFGCPMRSRPSLEAAPGVPREATGLRMAEWEVDHIRAAVAASGPATVLVIILHGAGPGSVGREDRHLDFFRTSMAGLAEDAFPELHEAGALALDFLCVDWRVDMHAEAPELDASVAAVRLNGIRTVREFLDSHLPDVLLYAEHGRRDQVLRVLQRNMNAAYVDWRRRRPSAPGTTHVVIATHCLASLMAHALLGRDDLPLAFPVTALFTMGTPFGWFFPIDGHTLGSLSHVFASGPGCPYFYNIVHPYDPLAARLEPFVHKPLGDQPPVDLLYWKTEGSLNLSRGSTAAASVAAFVLGLALVPIPLLSLPIAALGGILAYRNGKVVEEVSDAFGTAKPDHWVEGRYDFQVQTEVTEEISEHAAMLSAHHMYWTNRDVSFFILTQIYRCVFLRTTLGLVTLPVAPSRPATPVARSPVMGPRHSWQPHGPGLTLALPDEEIEVDP
jgi:hypothetical protein